MAAEIPFLFMFASYAFWVLLPVFLATTIYNIIYGLRTSLESKRLRKASLSKKGINLKFGDDGFVDLEILEQTKSEGAATTNKDIDSTKRWTGLFSRKQITPSDEELANKVGLTTNDEVAQKTGMKKATDEQRVILRKAFLALNELATTKNFLRHSKIPIWISYSGKAVLASVQSLAAMEITDKLKAELEKVKIDGQMIKSLFPPSWNQSQIRANEIEAFQEGRLEEKRRNKKGSEKMFMYLVLGVGFAFGMAAIMVVVLYLTK